MENCRMLRNRDFTNIFFACVVDFSSKSENFGAKNVERLGWGTSTIRNSKEFAFISFDAALAEKKEKPTLTW